MNNSERNDYVIYYDRIDECWTGTESELHEYIEKLVNHGACDIAVEKMI